MFPASLVLRTKSALLQNPQRYSAIVFIAACFLPEHGLFDTCKTYMFADLYPPHWSACEIGRETGVETPTKDNQHLCIFNLAIQPEALAFYVAYCRDRKLVRGCVDLMQRLLRKINPTSLNKDDTDELLCRTKVATTESTGCPATPVQSRPAWRSRFAMLGEVRQEGLTRPKEHAKTAWVCGQKPF